MSGSERFYGGRWHVTATIGGAIGRVVVRVSHEDLDTARLLVYRLVMQLREVSNA